LKARGGPVERSKTNCRIRTNASCFQTEKRTFAFSCVFIGIPSIRRRIDRARSRRKRKAGESEQANAG